MLVEHKVMSSAIILNRFQFWKISFAQKSAAELHSETVGADEGVDGQGNQLLFLFPVHLNLCLVKVAVSICNIVGWWQEMTF
jgi:hypothetical protein